VDTWNIVNLNSLSYFPKNKLKEDIWIEWQKNDCIYYGSYRKNRDKYFKKYIDNNIILSTHRKNIEKFKDINPKRIIGRINWKKRGLFDYYTSLYIEDENTHKYYNFLANRFYEALNYGCIPIFSIECQKTTELSGYNISKDYFISNSNQIKNKLNLPILTEWKEKAEKEKQETIKQIKQILEV
jgi:hypothetical protein